LQPHILSGSSPPYSADLIWGRRNGKVKDVEMVSTLLNSKSERERRWEPFLNNTNPKDLHPVLRFIRVLGNPKDKWKVVCRDLIAQRMKEFKSTRQQ
jgi:hypothetical protein